MTKKRVAISTIAPDKTEAAVALAHRLQLEFVADFQATEFDYILLFTADYLGLYKPGSKLSHTFYIDFLSGKLAYRSQHAGLRRELLARAIGFKPKEHPSIIDATAGLGRDSFILATLGFEVTLLERSPILHALLEDALGRAQSDAKMALIIERLHLIHADAITWLPTLALQHRPQVIYLDPMFPERQKSASIKKEMAILQDLLGKDEDAAKLFQVVFACATQRVVVKRPRLATNIAEHAPNFSLPGKSSRFDVYLK